MPSDKPKLSVLVPVYNAEKYIALALKSILVQTYSNLEILVCDDCSTDNTFSIISNVTHSNLRVFRNSSNLGKNGATDFLLSQSTGEFITIHDADDISLPERFEKQMNFLLNNPDHVLCGTNYISFLDNGKIIDKSDLEQNSDRIREKIKNESQFHGPTVVFRRDILSKIGGLYRYYTRGEDIDFTMRVAQKFKAINLPDYLYLYRHVTTSMTNTINGYNIERLGHLKLLYYLHKEREENGGMDCLMLGDDKKVKELMVNFTEEYRDDPTIALRRGVFRLLGMRMYSNAIKLSLLSLKQDLNMLNFKCVVYTCFACLYGYWKLFKMKEKVDLTFLDPN